MSKHDLTVVVYREDERYVAQCLEVDVSSFGDTKDEAVEMITEALELYLEGDGVPAQVQDPALVTVEVNASDG